MTESSVTIDLAKDIEFQLASTNSNNMHINVVKIDNLIPLFTFIQTRLAHKQRVIVSINPYSSSQLTVPNDNKYTFIFNKGVLACSFVNDNFIDVSTNILFIGNLISLGTWGETVAYASLDDWEIKQRSDIEDQESFNRHSLVNFGIYNDNTIYDPADLPKNTIILTFDKTEDEEELPQNELPDTINSIAADENLPKNEPADTIDSIVADELNDRECIKYNETYNFNDIIERQFVIVNRSVMHFDIVIAFFKMYQHIKYYAWYDDIKNMGSGAEYGPPSGIYKRHPKYDHILIIEDYSSCCCYSGRTSIYNLLLNKHIYGSCGCYYSEEKCNNAIDINEIECDSSNDNIDGSVQIPALS